MSDLYGYVNTGNAWPHPELVTISFVPDGSDRGDVKSNLFAYWCQRGVSASTWQGVVAKAAQFWANQTNVNFSVVYDNGAGMGTSEAGLYVQGSPLVGDVRIGGYNFFNANVLAATYQPPPEASGNLAGDIDFNTGLSWFLNGIDDYDFFTVALHEIGHALGLGHTTVNPAAMYYYVAPLFTLYSDDIAGIRSIYSSGNPRSADSYEGNDSFAAATDITGLMNVTIITPYLDLTTTSDVDYLKVVAPLSTTGTMIVKAQSEGLSFLAVELHVYDSGQTQLATASSTGNFGGVATCTVSVTSGQTYYIRVRSLVNPPFGTGRYAVTVQFGTVDPGPVPPPNTQTLES